jgi:hypothetical protein
MEAQRFWREARREPAPAAHKPSKTTSSPLRKKTRSHNATADSQQYNNVMGGRGVSNNAYGFNGE